MQRDAEALVASLMLLCMSHRYLYLTGSEGAEFGKYPPATGTEGESTSLPFCVPSANFWVTKANSVLWSGTEKEI